jgi:hypothetical protein
MNIFLLSELVNKDGSRIKGGDKVNQNDNVASTKITTDDFVRMTRQGTSRYNNYGRAYYGEDDESNSDTELPKEDKKKTNPKKPIKKIKESGKKKMGSLIEDIFTKKDFDREFVDTRSKDFRLNGIPELDVVKETNPILIRKVGALKDIIEKNSTSGEEKAIILNYLLSMDITDISQEYKQELKKKLS